MPASQFYEFDRFRLEPRDRSVLRDGRPIPLQPKLYETLLALVTSGGRLVTKEDLIHRVWEDAVVEEGSLTRNIYLLRKVLGDEFIETVPKAGYRFKAHVRQGPEITSIAVLPFVSLGPDEIEYLVDGVTEELIDMLAQLPSMKVVARTSVFQFKGQNRDIREIGNKLGVDTVLEASIRRQGERLRVTAQLNRTADGFHIWSHAYDLESKEVIPLEREIASVVAAKLEATFAPEGPHAPQPSAIAYDLYAKGRFLANDDSNRFIGEAIQHYEQAIAADPSFAAAYAGLADALVRLVTYGVLPANEGMPKVRQASTRAISLDPANAQAHMLLGMVYNLFDWNWEAAEREYQAAIHLSPSYAFVRYIYSYFLLAPRQRFAEASAQLERAQYLDPLSTHIQAARISLLSFHRKYKEAVDVGRQVVQLDPRSYLAAIQFGWALQYVGEFDAALEQYEQARSLGGAPGLVNASIGLYHMDRGDFDTALRMFAGDSFNTARVYAAMRDRTQALAFLRLALEEHSIGAVFLDTLPQFDCLRGDPEYEEIRQRLGLVPV